MASVQNADSSAYLSVVNILIQSCHLLTKWVGLISVISWISVNSKIVSSMTCHKTVHLKEVVQIGSRSGLDSINRIVLNRLYLNLCKRKNACNTFNRWARWILKFNHYALFHSLFTGVASFTPKAKGTYQVQVTQDGKPFSGSPFKINVGEGQVNQIDETNLFLVLN